METPNKDIDDAIQALMKQIKPAKGQTVSSIPPDVAVKIINSAVNWEKVKNHIKDDDSGFDPDLI